MIAESWTGFFDHVRLLMFAPTPHENWTGVTGLRSTNYVFIIVEMDGCVSDSGKQDHPDIEPETISRERRPLSERQQISSPRVRRFRTGQTRVRAGHPLMPLKMLRNRFYTTDDEGCVR